MDHGRITTTRKSLLRLQIAGACFAILIASASTSVAQLPAGSGFGTPASQQINNPAVSPFLNLAQPGINPGIAYQTLVAPQLQLQSAVALQQQQIGALQQAATPGHVLAPSLTPTGNLGTGHPTYFLNTFSYFPNAKSR